MTSALKKAQRLANEVDQEFDLYIPAFSTTELEKLKDRLTAFLDLGIDPEDLQDPVDFDEDDVSDLDDEFYDLDNNVSYDDFDDSESKEEL